MRRRRPAIALALLTALVLLAGCGSTSPTTPTPAATTNAPAAPAAATTTTDTGLPDSMVVLGHSGATGLNADPSFPGRDAPEDSWATGTNPAVDSVYLRLLARNPAIRGHNANLAEDGATVDDLVPQARQAVTLEPLPKLVLVQTVDNDIRGCDGSDAANYAPFERTLHEALAIIAKGAPGTRILLVTQPGTVLANMRAVADHPEWVAPLTDDGPCGLFDRKGRIATKNVARLQAITDAYFARLEAACTGIPNCHADGGAWQRMPLDAGDFSSDGNHPSLAGQAKRAAVTWQTLALD